MLIKNPSLRYWIAALAPVAEAIVAGGGRAAVGAAAKEAAVPIAKQAIKSSATHAAVSGGDDGGSSAGTEQKQFTVQDESNALSRVANFSLGSHG